ncbi:GIY-YIG nuclease family protein [Xanthomonas sp. NCPPB 1067]|uniref:NUMOD3 domain-containing DNA-binding protein n=1 Tax=Xanthomonas sp. NCPPB 1067 TaxID=487524 RepID=UPI001E483951|nr:NUMOD3 domain-containing DNA-binding protein [Xanthomonas sp. NCPPB 1067]MCC4588742.1 GIY-YIG nuclease family protein [Xanthomonas sp. NCPPB 1067]
MAVITPEQAGGVIYALIDPVSGHVFYVGRTTQTLEKRLSNHLAAAKRCPDRPVCARINDLRGEGLRPAARVLELLAPTSDWQAREKWWIAYHRERGPLSNLTDGGLGWSGHKHSEAERLRIGIAHRGKCISKEQRQKLSAARRGSRPSSATRAKLSKASRGRVVSEATKKRLSEAKRGKPLPSLAGAKNHRAVLTESAVRDIRTGRLGQKSVATLFGVSRSQFYRVKRGEQWSSIV